MHINALYLAPCDDYVHCNDDVDVDDNDDAVVVVDVVDDIKCAVNHRVIKPDDQATVQEVVSHQAGCHRSRLTICRLVDFVKSEANPYNNLMMRRLAYTSLGVVTASRFHKEIVLVQTANSTMVSVYGFITKSKLSRDLSV